jgi:protein SCO1
MMKLVVIKKALALALMVLVFNGVFAAVPRDSVYQLNAILTDQNGSKSQWADAPKSVRIVSMFYSNCDYVCPLLFEAIKRAEATLPADQRAHLSVGLVSLDPVRDTPAALKRAAAQRDVDEVRWHLYRAAPADVRKIAALLGVQYRQLSSGEFNHSTVMILLDAQGRVLARTEKISGPDPAFLEALRKALAAT